MIGDWAPTPLVGRHLDRRAETDGELAATRKTGAPGKRFECAVDIRRYDIDSGPHRQHSDSRFERQQLAVGGARAFREHHQNVSQLQGPAAELQVPHEAPPPVEGEHVQRMKEGGPERRIEEIVSRPESIGQVRPGPAGGR